MIDTTKKMTTMDLFKFKNLLAIFTVFIACEKALLSEKERRKQRARTREETGRGGGLGTRGRGNAPSSSPVYARVASLGDLFSRFLPRRQDGV